MQLHPGTDRKLGCVGCCWATNTLRGCMRLEGCQSAHLASLSVSMQRWSRCVNCSRSSDQPCRDMDMEANCIRLWQPLVATDAATQPDLA